MNENKKTMAGAALIVVLAALAPVRSPASAGAESDLDVCLLSWVRRSKAGTERCITCHDGSAGPAVHVGPGGGRNHSVGVRYDETKSHTMLRPAAMLPPELVLVNGAVDCTSCHDGSSRLPHRIAVTPERLCAGCHTA